MLALDSLRFGLSVHFSHGAEGGQVDDLDVLSIAAMGSVDEEWSVRVAAARLAGEVLERAVEKRSVMLSSEQARRVLTCPRRGSVTWKACIPYSVHQYFFVRFYRQPQVEFSFLRS